MLAFSMMALSFGACSSDDDNGDGGSSDLGTLRDVGGTLEDSGTVVEDSGTEQEDSGADAGRDGGRDGATDGGRDAGRDGGSDGGRDGASDGGSDGGRDGGTIEDGGVGRDAGTIGQDGGASGASFCIEHCSQDEDCTVGGQNLGLVCRNAFCASPTPPPSCQTDLGCSAQLSGWQMTCSSSGDCGGGFVCIDVEGAGRCAFEETQVISCTTLGMTAMTATRLDVAASVTVCGSIGRCEASGVCSRPCPENACPQHFTCDSSTSQCVCADDMACQGGNTSVCRQGRCECASNNDCTINADTCTNGTCYCSSSAVCTERAFDSSTISCDSF